MKKFAHVLSFSGGKDSTALYLLAIERGKPFRPVFADTMNEHEAVYEALESLPRLTGGPAIEIVRADFSAQLARRAGMIAEKWRADGVAEDVVAEAIEILRPSGSAFLDLCLWKGIFPSAKARFCTEFLKVKPIEAGVYKPLLADGRAVVSWQGVRAEESLARSLLPKWQKLEAGKGNRVFAYRPLIDWKLADVWAMHERHGVPRNRLYDQGMTRIGCMPCIMAKKPELREIAGRFPGHVDKIEQWERLVAKVSRRGMATFFAACDDPLYQDGDVVTHESFGIRSRVEWSKTSRGGKQYDLELASADFNTACNQWGACE